VEELGIWGERTKDSDNAILSLAMCRGAGIGRRFTFLLCESTAVCRNQKPLSYSCILLRYRPRLNAALGV